MKAISPTASGSQQHRLLVSRQLCHTPLQSVRQRCNLACGRSPGTSAISGAWKRSPFHPSQGPTSTSLHATAARGAGPSKFLPPPESRQLLLSTWNMLKSSFWPVLLIYATKDTMAFILHRLGHRLTNLVAEAVLGIPLSSMINTWWLHLDSRFLEANFGYQAIIALVFFLCLPLNILLNSYALSATMHVTKARAKAGAAAAAAAPASGTQQGLATEAAGSSVAAAAHPGAESAAAAGAHGRPEVAASSPQDSHVAEPSSSSSAPGPSPAPLQAHHASPGQTLPASSAADAAHASTSTSQPATPRSWAERAASILGFGEPTTSSSSPAAAGGGTADASASTSAAAAGAAAAAVPASAPKQGIIRSLRLAWAEAWAVTPEVNKNLPRVWRADLLFNMHALPLQALSVLVIPLFWTLPKLLAIQLAVPSAIAERLDGKAALERSTQLMKGFERAYAWPFAALFLSLRIVDMVRTLLLTLVPPRWWQEIIELPILLILAFGFARIVVIRLQDIMPATMYLHLSNSSATEQQPEVEPLVTETAPVSSSVPSM